MDAQIDLFLKNRGLGARIGDRQVPFEPKPVLTLPDLQEMIKDSSVTEQLRDLIRRRGAELTVEEIFAVIEKYILEMQASKLF